MPTPNIDSLRKMEKGDLNDSCLSFKMQGSPLLTGKTEEVAEGNLFDSPALRA